MNAGADFLRRLALHHNDHGAELLRSALEARSAGCRHLARQFLRQAKACRRRFVETLDLFGELVA